VKKLLSLFTGGGGLDIGFEAAGFSTLLAADNLGPAIETLARNRPKMSLFGPPWHSGDVRDLDLGVVSTLIGKRSGSIDMMIGGPPCQPFSVAAAQRFLSTDSRFKRIGFESEDKGQLIFEYVRIIQEVRPKCFLIENVPGILSLDNGTGISKVYEILEQSGYTLSDPFVLNAKDFGVPQSRVRAFVVGSLNGKKMVKPVPTHAAEADLLHMRHVSVAQALYGIPEGAPNHELRSHQHASIERYKNLKFGEREKKGRVDRLDPDKPSKTVIAGGSKGGGRSHLHPFEARTLSVRECARLQTFPDSYIFEGSIGRQFTLVGNAVPPLLGEILGREILKQIFNISVEGPLKLSFSPTDPVAAVDSLLKQSLDRSPQLLYNDLIAV